MGSYRVMSAESGYAKTDENRIWNTVSISRLTSGAKERKLSVDVTSDSWTSMRINPENQASEEKEENFYVM